MINDERFCELAHKALAKEAQPAEQAELQTLLTGNPTLKREFEEMGAEAAIAREILPLLEDIEHPAGRIPQPPVERLKREIAKVFQRRSGAMGELRGLLAQLETWVSGATRAEGQHVMEWLSALRATLSAERGESAGAAEPLLSAMMEQSPSLSLRAGHELAERREAELESRLRHLEQRISQIERVAHDGIARTAHECIQEVRALVRDLKREAGSGTLTSVKSGDPSKRR